MGLEMLEVIICFSLFVIGYTLGNFDGWSAGLKFLEKEKKKMAAIKDKSPLYNDYSHLKRNAPIEPEAPSASISHMSTKKMCEKIYDAEVVDSEIRINKVI